VAALGLHLAAFRPYRRQAMGFLVSRCVISGAGTLEDDGAFTLSEKAGGIRRIMRWTVMSGDRGLFEIGHLVKPLHAVGWFDWRGVAKLFQRRQRLQLGLSDANLCQVAEYLKVGATALVLDLVDAGRLGDAPVPADPVRALQFLASDPDLSAEIPLEGGGRMTALELQRYYLGRAEEWLREEPAVSLEARRVVDLWRSVLDALATSPSSLVGRLDWVTKRQLLHETADLEHDARKKVDLRYHELGTGYHAWLDEAGATVRLVGDDEADRARREPPDDTPAADRGALVRELSGLDTEARIGWDHARVGGAMSGRIIRFDASRRRKPAE
jgi:proteasome accessory factor A